MKTNLYLVTCCYKPAYSADTYDVYVLAESETDASEKALKAMRDAKYKFDEYVSTVVLVATSDRHKGPVWLVGAK